MKEKKIIGMAIVCIFLTLALVPINAMSTADVNTMSEEGKTSSETTDDEYEIKGGFSIHFYSPARIGTKYYVKYEPLFQRETEHSREIVSSHATFKRNGILYAKVTARIIYGGVTRCEETGSQFGPFVFF